MESIKVSDTRMVFNHRFMPDAVNPYGFVHGGHVMALMDHVAGLTGYRYARQRIVTASVEHMSFHSPLHVGELLICYTSINRVWGSAMEIGIRGVEEHLQTGEQTHVLTCYMTFVALDAQGKPSPLPPLIAETDDDRRRMADAGRRMGQSLMERKVGFARKDTLRICVEQNEFAICTLSAASTNMGELFSAVMEPGACMAVAQIQGNMRCVVDTAVADKLQAMCPDLFIEAGYSCLRMELPAESLPHSPLSGILPLLESCGIPVFPITTSFSACVIIPSAQRQKATDILQSAGYSLYAR